ncbi:MAG: phenylacetate--CoA ligase family protein, partial [Alphaproteobacteria bacterium]
VAGRRMAFETSGSTGRPIAGAQTEHWRHHWEAVTVRDNLWHRRNLKARLAALVYPPEGVPSTPDGVEGTIWNIGLAGAFVNGRSLLFDVNRPIAEQLAWLIKVQPDYLRTYPSVLRELLRDTQGQRPPVPGLRAVITLGEQLHDGLREQLREQWNVPLQDIYSSVEVGYLALQCPTGAHYHVQSEVALVEILDDNDQPCAPGQIGRVVATPLQNFAMPLIRYAVGDFAEFGPPCACGRGLPVLTRVHGRVRNMLTRPDGSVVWPNISVPMSRSKLPILQFQAVQRAPAKLDVRLVTARPLTGAEEDLLRKLLSDGSGVAFEIDFHYLASIPRHARGKYEDFYSEVASAQASNSAASNGAASSNPVPA